MEIRRITEKHASHRDGRRRCTERRDRDTKLEPPHKLFQHENRARHRCVERGGKAGTRTGRKQHPAIWPLAAEDFSDQVGNARPHLHARALATERKSGADCEDAAAEFHPDEVKRRLRDFLVQHGLDMGDAASRCVRRESADQPGRYQGRGSTSRHNEQKSRKLFALCPSDQRITQTVRLFKRKPEDRSHKPCRRADDERQ